MSVLVDVAALRSALDVPEGVATDADLQGVCDAVDAAVLPLLTAEHTDPGTTHANCQEAGLGIAVQVWGSRRAPGGQMVGLDMNPQMTPHLLGPALVTKYQGLLGPCTPYGGAVVA